MHFKVIVHLVKKFQGRKGPVPDVLRGAGPSWPTKRLASWPFKGSE